MPVMVLQKKISRVSMSWKSFSVWHLFFRLDIFVVILEPSPPVKDYRFSVGQLPSWAQKQVGWFKTVLFCGACACYSCCLCARFYYPNQPNSLTSLRSRPLEVISARGRHARPCWWRGFIWIMMFSAQVFVLSWWKVELLCISLTYGGTWLNIMLVVSAPPGILMKLFFFCLLI